jgi:hypothetical protein
VLRRSRRYVDTVLASQFDGVDSSYLFRRAALVAVAIDDVESFRRVLSLFRADGGLMMLRHSIVNVVQDFIKMVGRRQLVNEQTIAAASTACAAALRALVRWLVRRDDVMSDSSVRLTVRAADYLRTLGFGAEAIEVAEHCRGLCDDIPGDDWELSTILYSFGTLRHARANTR